MEEPCQGKETDPKATPVPSPEEVRQTIQIFLAYIHSFSVTFFPQAQPRFLKTHNMEALADLAQQAQCADAFFKTIRWITPTPPKDT